MIPATFNFKPQYKGSSFKGANIKLERNVNGTITPVDLTGVNISVRFKKSLEGATEKTLTIGNGLTVSNPIDGIVTMDSFLITLPAYKYLYDFKLTFPDGTVDVYFVGTFEVKQNLV